MGGERGKMVKIVAEINLYRRHASKQPSESHAELTETHN